MYILDVKNVFNWVYMFVVFHSLKNFAFWLSIFLKYLSDWAGFFVVDKTRDMIQILIYGVYKSLSYTDYTQQQRQGRETNT